MQDVRSALESNAKERDMLKEDINSNRIIVEQDQKTNSDQIELINKNYTNLKEFVNAFNIKVDKFRYFLD